jgi:hypothetical protein
LANGRAHGPCSDPDPDRQPADFQRKDGSKVAFVNFPAIASSPPGIRGNWVAADIEAVLTARIE